MVGWYIAGAVLGLLLLILLLPIGVRLEYGDELFLWLRIAGFSIPILPVQEEEEEVSQKTNPKKKKRKKEPEVSHKKEPENKSQKSAGFGAKMKEIAKYQGISGVLSRPYC